MRVDVGFNFDDQVTQLLGKSYVAFPSNYIYSSVIIIMQRYGINTILGYLKLMMIVLLSFPVLMMCRSTHDDESSDDDDIDSGDKLSRKARRDKRVAEEEVSA